MSDEDIPRKLGSVYTADFKLAVIDYSKKTSVSKASEKYKVHRRSVWNWVKLEDQIQNFGDHGNSSKFEKMGLSVPMRGDLETTRSLRKRVVSTAKNNTEDESNDSSEDEKNRKKKIKRKARKKSHGKRETSYSCEECGKTFINLERLKKHNISMHTDERPFECKVCHLTFKFKERLKAHEVRHSDREYLFCSICNKHLITLRRFRRHICRDRCLRSGEFPSEDTRFKCIECRKEFKTQLGLQVHTSLSH